MNYMLKTVILHRKANPKLNQVFERALRIACKDSGNNSLNTYRNLNKSATIHQRNLQLLMIEIFKNLIQRTTLIIRLL